MIHHQGVLNLFVTNLLQTVVVVSILSPKPRILERKGHVLKILKNDVLQITKLMLNCLRYVKGYCLPATES